MIEYESIVNSVSDNVFLTDYSSPVAKHFIVLLNQFLFASFILEVEIGISSS